MNNPLLTLSANDQPLPFDQIKDEHFKPAFAKALEIAHHNLKAIADSTAAPTFANTVEALEGFKEDLDQIAAIFFNYTSAHTNETLQDLAKEISPQLASLANDVFLNQAIFTRVEKIFEQKEELGFDLEQKELLDKTYKSFRRNGALLDPIHKEKLRAVDQEMATLSHEFSDNTLKDTNEYEMVIKDRSELEGLPDSAIESAAETAKERGHEGKWVFTCQAPSYVPFLKYADNGKLRETLWRAVGSRCMGGATDNRPILKQIANLRFERAALLGYHNYAELVLEERMAGTPSEVTAFLSKLLLASKPAAQRELEELRKLSAELGHGGAMSPWDIPYYAEKLKQQRFEMNEEELRPYFKLENVVKGLFLHADKLYGLEFTERSDLPVYHPDVKGYEVKDKENGRFMGYFYADFFPRASKRSGAWMTAYREQGLWKGKVLRPHISIVCNVAKPTATRPALLTQGEVSTLFHEFGHALHGLLSDCRYISLAGTNVYWDFVELPSQLMENWASEEEALGLFAEHYQTGAKVPGEWIEKIRKSKQFMAAFQSLRQIALGLIDMAWHGVDPRAAEEVEIYEKQASKEAQLLPPIAGTAVSPSFNHIFHGGYAAGYYSYKWAEVLDADAFEHFQEKGLFNRELGRKFRDNVLSRGATEHPMILYKRFRGRAPDPNALLRRDGLL